MTQPERHWLDEGRHGPTPEEVASAITSCPAPAPAPTGLRDLYAAAIASYDHAVGQATDPAPRDHHYGQADAALAVRDREVERLQQRLALADQVHRENAATIERVRAECDRIEAAVRANPTAPDFDGAYLAAIGHIRRVLNPQEQP